MINHNTGSVTLHTDMFSTTVLGLDADVRALCNNIIVVVLTNTLSVFSKLVCARLHVTDPIAILRLFQIVCEIHIVYNLELVNPQGATTPDGVTANSIYEEISADIHRTKLASVAINTDTAMELGSIADLLKLHNIPNASLVDEYVHIPLAWCHDHTNVCVHIGQI